MCVLNGSVPAAQFALPLLRVQPGRQALVIMSGCPVVGVALHWIGGRTYMCVGEGANCEGCHLYPTRVLGYVTAYHEHEGSVRRVIIEASLNGLNELCEAFPMYARGQRVKVCRSAVKRPLTFSPMGETVTVPGSGDDVVRITRALAVLYRLPQPMPGEDLKKFVERTREARDESIRRAVLAAS